MTQGRVATSTKGAGCRPSGCVVGAFTTRAMSRFVADTPAVLPGMTTRVSAGIGEE